MKKVLIARYSNSAISFYGALPTNALNLKIIFCFFKYLKWPHLTFDQYKTELLNNKHLESGDGDALYTDVTILNNEMVSIISTYTSDEEAMGARLKYYSDFTKEQFKQFQILIKINDFLELLKEFLYHAHAKTPYIILYEDENQKVYCEEYFPTEEEKASNWKVMPNNHTK